MTRGEVLAMAYRAGTTFTTEAGVASATPDWLEQFARLIAKAEREACAAICREGATKCGHEAQIAGAAHEHDEAVSLRATAWQLTVCANRIEARNKK